LRFGIPYLIKNQKKHAIIKQSILISEIIVWVFYLCWFIFQFLKSRSFFVIIVFAILLFVLYVVGRLWIIDLIAGIIFKSGRQLKKGDYIEKDEHKGIVYKLGSRFLVLENTDGNMIYLPYHKITSSVFKKNETIDQKSGYSFELETNRKETYENVVASIRKSIIALPWSSLHKTPVITLLDQTTDRYIIKITVFTIDKSFAAKLEAHIKKLYGTH